VGGTQSSGLIKGYEPTVKVAESPVMREVKRQVGYIVQQV